MQENVIFHLFNTYRHYYLYDVNSNSILEINKELNSEIREFEKTRIISPTISKLQQKGFLLPRKYYEMLHPATNSIDILTERNIQGIALQVTQNCNLRCNYCVYSGSYQNRIHTNKRMSMETAFRAIDFLLEHSIDSENLGLGFYGGEPLLEFELIKKCIQYIKGKTNKEVLITLTTNATLINREIIEFFSKNDVYLTISLDGPQEFHDKNRIKNISGKGSYDDVIKSINLIMEEYPDYAKKVNFNAVVSTLEDFSLVNDFFTQTEPIKNFSVRINFETLSNSNKKRELSEEFIKEYYYEIFKYFMFKIGKIEQSQASKLIAPYFQQLKEFNERLKLCANNVIQDHPSGPCIIGKQRLFVDVEGILYPCERVSETSPIMRIGSIFDGFDIDRIKYLMNIGTLSEDKCRKCWAFRFCNICAVKADDMTTLSARKKCESCPSVIDNADDTLKNYCMLREFGYMFDDGGEL